MRMHELHLRTLMAQGWRKKSHSRHGACVIDSHTNIQSTYITLSSTVISVEHNIFPAGSLYIFLLPGMTAYFTSRRLLCRMFSPLCFPDRGERGCSLKHKLYPREVSFLCYQTFSSLKDRDCPVWIILTLLNHVHVPKYILHLAYMASLDSNAKCDTHTVEPCIPQPSPFFT